MTIDTIYIIDTSSLIDLQRWRPQNKHGAVWQKLDGMIRDCRLIAPEQVYDELRTGKDSLAKWAASHKKGGRLFKKTTRQHVGIAKQIIHHYSGLIDADRTGSQADPFVIALAHFEANSTTLAQRCIVVTNEKYTPTCPFRRPHLHSFRVNRQAIAVSTWEVLDGEFWAGLGEGAAVAGARGAAVGEWALRAGVLPAGRAERGVVLRLAADDRPAGRPACVRASVSGVRAGGGDGRAAGWIRARALRRSRLTVAGDDPDRAPGRVRRGP
jgi:hypothetical protein